MTEEKAVEWAKANLETFFVPEKIETIIRRHAPAFDGDRAIDWIMAGREEEVKNKYNSLLIEWHNA